MDLTTLRKKMKPIFLFKGRNYNHLLSIWTWNNDGSLMKWTYIFLNSYHMFNVDHLYITIQIECIWLPDKLSDW